MTTISLICSTELCNESKVLNESVKITELDDFTSLIHHSKKLPYR